MATRARLASARCARLLLRQRQEAQLAGAVDVELELAERSRAAVEPQRAHAGQVDAQPHADADLALAERARLVAVLEAELRRAAVLELQHAAREALDAQRAV